MTNTARGELFWPRPQVAPAPLDHLRRMMGEWVVSVDSSANLVVVRAPPGCAHVVASALDRSALGGVFGSVAGDDTILVIAAKAHGGGQARRPIFARWRESAI